MRQSRTSWTEHCRHCGGAIRRSKRNSKDDQIQCGNCGLQYREPGNGGSLPRPVGHATRDRVIGMINSSRRGVRRRGLTLAKRAKSGTGIIHGSITGRKCGRKAVAK